MLHLLPSCIFYYSMLLSFIINYPQCAHIETVFYFNVCKISLGRTRVFDIFTTIFSSFPDYLLAKECPSKFSAVKWLWISYTTKSIHPSTCDNSIPFNKNGHSYFLLLVVLDLLLLLFFFAFYFYMFSLYHNLKVPFHFHFFISIGIRFLESNNKSL